MFRVEDKYICTEKDMFLLQSRINSVLSPDSYSQGSSYKITSLYFDDYNNSHMTDSEDGVGWRNKYRIRIYNDSSDIIKLEIKYKTYNRVYKKSQTISRDTADALIEGRGIDNSDVSPDSPVFLFDLALKQDLLRPRVIVEYDRSAYVFAPGNVRITFDRNIRVCRDISGFFNAGCDFTMLPDLNRILEIKYDEFLPGFIARLLENGNMIQTSYSKYGLCMEQLEV